MARKPDRLSIDEDDKALYDEIAQDVFLGRQNKDRFLFAMAFGFWRGADREIDKREGFVRAEYLTPQDKALIDALAVAEAQSAAVLANRERVYEIAERYAHGGILLLHDHVQSTQFGSFYKGFERDMFDLIGSSYCQLKDTR